MSELAGADTWQPPTLRVIGPGGAEAEQARQIEAARERGYREGLQQGQEAARQQAQTLLAEMTALWDAMQLPFADMEQDVHSHLLGLAVAISEAVLRRELRTDSDLIGRALEDALAALGRVEQTVEVTVSPQDHDLVVGLLDEEGVDHRLKADPNMLRGGCLLRAGQALVDARIETLVHEALVSIAGETRQVDSGGRETAAALSVGEIESIADRFSADGSPQPATPPAEADDD